MYVLCAVHGEHPRVDSCSVQAREGHPAHERREHLRAVVHPVAARQQTQDTAASLPAGVLGGRSLCYIALHCPGVCIHSHEQSTEHTVTAMESWYSLF